MGRVHGLQTADHIIRNLVHDMHRTAVHIEDNVISIILVLMYHNRYPTFILIHLPPEIFSVNKRKAAAEVAAFHCFIFHILLTLICYVADL